MRVRIGVRMRGKDGYQMSPYYIAISYLLYGPPGTGKSSLIAAIANHLNYDIYELELAEVGSNSDLKRRLFAMPDQSILVIEDIDCTVMLQNRKQRMKNGVPGKIRLPRPCCTDERIIILTTNHKEKLDPALVRPGRMDMHIYMSYCTISAFEQLVFNYHGLCHHQLFEQIEGLIKEVKVTPADVARELMKGRDAQTSLQGLINFLLEKKTQQDYEPKTNTICTKEEHPQGGGGGGEQELM